MATAMLPVWRIYIMRQHDVFNSAYYVPSVLSAGINIL